jgi:hypothetical protein
MKIIAFFLSLLLITSAAGAKETRYQGSTPAGPVVRSFLGIAPGDSVDFIRWELIILDDKYQLQCNYGIGKPNTNGFINGIKIKLSGALTSEKNYYQLTNGKKNLYVSELNTDLLHLLNADKSLLVGNGGWSYTLNSVTPSGTDQVNITAQPAILKDSMVFQGRTPCKVPGIVAPGSECYKLKWLITFYAHTGKNEAGSFRIKGTRWYEQGGKTGNWKILPGKNGRIIYQLNDEKENGFLYLLKLDEQILVFIDATGKLLVGDEDFSYTMNRK